MTLQSIFKAACYKAGFSIKRLRTKRSSSAVSAAPSTPVDCMSLLHKVNPYAGFDHTVYPDDSSGWGSQSPAFRELLTRTRPRLVIEVGTWKGGSALEMASVCRELKLGTKIICVDTWLGALEFWLNLEDAERYGSLQLKHGYPSVYYQFLANVCRRGFQDLIIPFPQTSATAALWFRCHGVQAELIYIDGSHEEEDVYGDLCDYWGLVAPGGSLFGDDYSWDGVRLAVNRFAREERLSLEFLSDKWVLRQRSSGS